MEGFRAFLGINDVDDEPRTAVDRSLLQSIFDEADKDGSKTLSAAECAEVLEGKLGDHDFETLLKTRLDEDEEGSGDLDFEQFCRVYNRVSEESAQQQLARPPTTKQLSARFPKHHSTTQSEFTHSYLITFVPVRTRAPFHRPPQQGTRLACYCGRRGSCGGGRRITGGEGAPDLLRWTCERRRQRGQLLGHVLLVGREKSGAAANAGGAPNEAH